MTRKAWINARCEASVAQGMGTWMEQAVDPVLGIGIFRWTGAPEVQVFEAGFVYLGDPGFCVLYDHIVDVGLLDLHSLMAAQKTPQELVEFTVTTSDDRYVLRVRLFCYTALSSLLNGLRRDG